MPSSTSSPLIVSLDIGTSSTRALLYESDGRMLKGREVQRKYQQTFTPDGGVECDADRLVAATLGALEDLMGLCDDSERARIAAVGSSCFWHALMGIDTRGAAVTPLYSWADTRSNGEVDALRKTLRQGSYHRRTGAFLHSCFWPAKIAWLRRTDPETASRVAHWVSFPDYLALTLSGRLATSVSIASATGLMNQARAAWDDETLAAISVGRASLPDIAGAGDTFRVQPGSRPRGTPDVAWFHAFGDGACSNIGAGGVDESRMIVNISTSGAVRVLCHKPPRTRRVAPGLFRYRLDRERWVIGGAMSNGGNVYAWIERTLQIQRPGQIDRALRQARPDGHGLTVLPFWAGERSPGWHAVAEAAVIGMNLSTRPLDIAQASLEAIAYTLQSTREDIALAFPTATEAIVSGGAVEHSRYMQQLIANVLATPVRVSLDREPSGRGAALAVAEQIGALSSLTAAPDRLSRVIAPDDEAVAIYERAHNRFQALYELLIGKPLGGPIARTSQIHRASQ